VNSKLMYIVLNVAFVWQEIQTEVVSFGHVLYLFLTHLFSQFSKSFFLYFCCNLS